MSLGALQTYEPNKNIVQWEFKFSYIQKYYTYLKNYNLSHYTSSKSVLHPKTKRKPDEQEDTIRKA